jgi:hypothetical protein
LFLDPQFIAGTLYYQFTVPGGTAVSFVPCGTVFLLQRFHAINRVGING